MSNRGWLAGVAVPMPRGRDVAAAAGLGVAVLVGGAVVAAFQHGDWPSVGAVVASVAAAGAWAWNRVAPMASSMAVVAIVAIYLVTGGPFGPIQIVVVLACFAVARYRSGRAAALTCGAEALALAAALSTRLGWSHLVATATILVAWPGVFAVIPALLGALFRVRANATARERDELLACGAYEERLRVAREVHDVAGHGFAVVAMQAGIALTVFDEEPAQARVSLEAIRTSSEHALRELQATLDDLHVGDPSVQRMPDLVNRVRAGGQPVELTVRGDAGIVTADVGVVVYRVVQEALTNVVRHAGPAAAEVVVEYGDNNVSVLVCDQGAGTSDDQRRENSGGPTGGRGLGGLRERVESMGGVFHAGNGVTGGFEVSATIPNEGAAP